MTKPNFKEMSYKELRAYVLSHTDDDEAFYAFADKFHEQPNLKVHPPLKSLEDFNNYPELLEKLRKDPGRRKES